MTETSKADQSKRLRREAKWRGVSYVSISRSFNTKPTNNSLHDGSLCEGVLIKGGSLVGACTYNSLHDGSLQELCERNGACADSSLCERERGTREFVITTHCVTNHRANCASAMELAPTTLCERARGIDPGGIIAQESLCQQLIVRRIIAKNVQAQWSSCHQLFTRAQRVD
jgi:hypothetical protein